MRILSIRFDANVQSPDGAGQYLTSADVRDGYEVEYDGNIFFVRCPKRWEGKFIAVPANRTLGAICESEPAAKGKK